jgi:hypothetical protein
MELVSILLLLLLFQFNLIDSLINILKLNFNKKNTKIDNRHNDYY